MTERGKVKERQEGRMTTLREAKMEENRGRDNGWKEWKRERL